MKKMLYRLLYILITLVFFIANFNLFALPPNDFVVPLCRLFSKDLLDLNTQNYLSPTVKIMNTVTNTGFYHSAYVPSKVSKPYFRLSLNGMYGGVSEELRNFTPRFPMQEFNYNTALGYLGKNDTVGLLNYFLQTLIYQGVVVDKTIVVPERASTALGVGDTHLNLPHSVMAELLKTHPAMALINIYYPDAANLVEEAVASLPENFTLYSGGDISRIIAGVPQLEIGSLYGTELLLRFIPPLDYGEYIGKFYFYGIGIKHSISQYFYKENICREVGSEIYNNNSFDENNQKRLIPSPFDVSVQFVYQNTGLKNIVGVTKAELNAIGNIFDFNINVSKNFDNIIEVYTGLGYEHINVNGTYKYYLPYEMQISLGLLKQDPNDPDNWYVDGDEYPGDTEPQTTAVTVNENHIKFTLGVTRDIGPVTMFIDYSISKFNVLSAGIQYRF